MIDTPRKLACNLAGRGRASVGEHMTVHRYLVASLLVTAACSTPAPDPAPPTTAAPARWTDPCAARTDGGAVVVLVVEHSTLRFWTTDSEFIDQAHVAMATNPVRTLMFEPLLEGGDCDAQWSWHPPPSDVDIVDFTTEVCDGRPLDVEATRDEWINHRYCPWQARIVDVDDRREGHREAPIVRTRGHATAATVASTGPVVDHCDIVRPNVSQPLTEYPDCVLHVGDEVTVLAGGCAQTGGLGRTWKRYVDPRGDDADHLYFGTLLLPGMPLGSPPDGIPLHAATCGSPIVVGAEGTLRLGYRDDPDGYGDNGYNDRDEGSPTQCRGEPDAWVRVTIVRAPAVAPTASP